MSRSNPYPDCPEKVSKPVRLASGGYCEMDIELGKWMRPDITVLGIQFLLEQGVTIITKKLETVSLRNRVIKYWDPDKSKISRITLEQAVLKILSSERIMFKK